MKGIRLHKASQKWSATLWFNGKAKHIGLFKTEAEAEYNLIKTKRILEEKGVVFGKRLENNYADNVELYKQIVISKAIGSLTPKALLTLMLMTKKISSKFRYNDESDRQDVIQNAHLTLLKNWRSFEEGAFENAFAYYTEIIKRAFAFEWKKLNKHRGHISIEGTYEAGKLNI
jgi:hypothetical protein